MGSNLCPYHVITKDAKSYAYVFFYQMVKIKSTACLGKVMVNSLQLGLQENLVQSKGWLSPAIVEIL